jgi:hypothetical protein
MTDPTLAERLARCVKPLDVHPEDVRRFPEYAANQQEQHRARILAALDLDALAQEVEAMVGAETERCQRIVSAARTGAIGTDFRTLLHFMGSKEQMLYDEKLHEYVPDHVRQDRELQAAIRAREGGGA